MLDKETHKGNKAALKCEVLAEEDEASLEEEEDEASLEEVEHAAREEARQLARAGAATDFVEAETTKGEAEVAGVEAAEYSHAFIFVGDL